MTDLVQFESPRPTGVHSRPPGARSPHASPAPAAQHLAQDHSGRTKLTGDSTAVRARQNIRSYCMGHAPGPPRSCRHGRAVRPRHRQAPRPTRPQDQSGRAGRVERGSRWV